ncbi:hypothetical protein [Hahella chejuensis]|uniref:hypothetical protein n=1 Tax=Hahella chejuensis TaxID=158327 RepID=UPI0030831550
MEKAALITSIVVKQSATARWAPFTVMPICAAALAKLCLLYPPRLASTSPQYLRKPSSPSLQHHPQAPEMMRIANNPRHP